MIKLLPLVPLNEVRHGDPPVISTTVSVTVASETARGGLPWSRPPSPQPLPSVAAWETLRKAEAHPHRPQPPRSVGPRPTTQVAGELVAWRDYPNLGGGIGVWLRGVSPCGERPVRGTWHRMRAPG